MSSYSHLASDQLTKSNLAMQDYSKALQEENYAEAARLRDQGAAGLRGWWVADNQEDPKGHLLRITTGFGRYMGYAYTPQDLAQAEVLFGPLVLPANPVVVLCLDGCP